MPQVQSKQAFPGFGIIYPGGGVRGIKVVKTFTQGATRMVQSDGSVTFSTPPPTIHELFGGGFCYADGTPVTNKKHLESITDTKMKERALKWFDMHGVAITPQDVVVKGEDATTDRPEPAYILSNQLPEGSLENGPVDMPKESLPVKPGSIEEGLSTIIKSISELSTVVQKQGEEITQLKSKPTEPRKRSEKDLMSKRSLAMRAKWSDPEFRKKREEMIKEKMDRAASRVDTDKKGQE